MVAPWNFRISLRLEIVKQNTVVRGYPQGMFLGDDTDPEQIHIAEYAVTEGER